MREGICKIVHKGICKIVHEGIYKIWMREYVRLCVWEYVRLYVVTQVVCRYITMPDTLPSCTGGGRGRTGGQQCLLMTRQRPAG